MERLNFPLLKPWQSCSVGDPVDRQHSTCRHGSCQPDWLIPSTRAARTAQLCPKETVQRLSVNCLPGPTQSEVEIWKSNTRHEEVAKGITVLACNFFFFFPSLQHFGIPHAEVEWISYFLCAQFPTAGEVPTCSQTVLQLKLRTHPTVVHSSSYFSNLRYTQLNVILLFFPNYCCYFKSKSRCISDRHPSCAHCCRDCVKPQYLQLLLL